MIRSAGRAAEARFGVIGEAIREYPEIPRQNFIDEEVFGKLRRFHLIPSELSEDGEFIRRVCLDLTGTLPPPERVREFLGSREEDKREKLIEALLESPEYVDYWTFRFADLFRVRGHYRWVHVYWEWVRRSLAENKSYDQMVRESIAAQGYDGPSRIYLIDNNKPPALERVVAEQFRVFMGRRMDCAQCHNHPYDRWTQDQFWGLAAFYRRVTNTDWAFDNVVFDDPDGHEVNFGEGKSTLSFRENRHPRTRQLVPPTFLDGRVLPGRDRRDLRRELAAWMTTHPYFAQATVNRMWGHFFGRGIVDPVDDFRLGNPPTHPNLLDRLARDFQEHGYDLKHLMRRIVSSRTYQTCQSTQCQQPGGPPELLARLPPSTGGGGSSGRDFDGNRCAGVVQGRGDVERNGAAWDPGHQFEISCQLCQSVSGGLRTPQAGCGRGQRRQGKPHAGPPYDGEPHL